MTPIQKQSSRQCNVDRQKSNEAKEQKPNIPTKSNKEVVLISKEINEISNYYCLEKITDSLTTILLSYKPKIQILHPSFAYVSLKKKSTLNNQHFDTVFYWNICSSFVVVWQSAHFCAFTVLVMIVCFSFTLGSVWADDAVSNFSLFTRCAATYSK